MGLNPRTIALVGSCRLITRSPRRLIRSGVRRWQKGSVSVEDRSKWSCRRQLPKWSRRPRSGVAANRDWQPRSSSRGFCPKRAPKAPSDSPGTRGGGQRAMVEELTLRPAQLADFAFCQRTYLEPMRPTIEKLGLDEASHLANFARQWQVEQVRIVMMHGQVIGWLQTAATDDALFLAQLFVDTSFQRQGIGSRLIRMLIEAAARENKAVTLGVVKTNPARRLYERLGFNPSSCPMAQIVFTGRDRAMSRSVAKKREADREKLQKGFPGCRFRGATVIADGSPAEEDGFETSVRPEKGPTSSRRLSVPSLLFREGPRGFESVLLRR